MEQCLLIEDIRRGVTSCTSDTGTVWSYMQAEELLASTLTLRELLRKLHDPKRLVAEGTRARLRRLCCVHGRRNKNSRSSSDHEYFDVNGNHRSRKKENFDDVFELSHSECPRFNQFRSCNHCNDCQADICRRPSATAESFQSLKKRQKNDRQAILQKFKEESETDSYPPNKPWYNSRFPDQNLQICYINDSCSSSDNEEDTSDSKASPAKLLGKFSPASSPAMPSPGFGKFRHPLYRMSSSSSLSSTSSGGHHTSSSSIPCDGEIINIRSSINTDDIPKIRTKQEQLEFQARIAITQAHQEARRLAEEERRRSRKESSTSYEKLLQVPLDDMTRMKVKTRSLSKEDCRRMAFGQLQVILNNMHMEKEALNSELKSILEVRDDRRTEQDAKLVDVDDMKAMLAATGPETTV